MRLLVTGAAGMLGHRVAAAASAAGHDVVAATRADADVTDAAAVDALLERTRPDAVVNCAAYTNVDGAEAEEALALAVNGAAAGHVAAAAARVGARVVHVSTDYVFDGSATRPWVESDATAPLGAYGRTKLAGELAVAAATPEHAIVRTAWVFGEGGGNFVDTMLRLGAQRDEISVVTDQVGCPTWTGHLAPALVAVAQRRGDTGIFHAAGAGQCSWHELAATALERAGVACRVLETTSAAFPRPAPRPAYSVLGSERAEAIVLADWREGLQGHLDDRSVAA